MSGLFMVDLFSGLGGASAAMRDRGWRVVTVDNEPTFEPSIVADVQALPFQADLHPDLLWASPPCTEFSAYQLPFRWHDHAPVPSVELVEATARAIELLEPRWWIVENVRAAVPFITPILGKHVQRIGSAYLWGSFPLLLLGQRPAAHKWRMGPRPDRAALRAKIPYEVSEAVALAVESVREIA